MRTRLSLLAALTTLVLAGSACSDEGSDDVARDPAPAGSSGPSGPPAAAVPDGPVRTRDLATVMDTGQGSQGPELCLGPVAESYPPQCGGPALLDWDWADHDGTYDEHGDVRWGTYALTGSWDGTSFSATEAVPGALYDPAMPTPTPTPTPAVAHSEDELEQIAAELQDAPGVLGAYGGEGSDGHVLADVIYDDGTLQGWADSTYGAGVVLVTSALVDVG
jgi:hypothetical protein